MLVGREGIEPTRAIKTRDLQSRPAPYGITCPYITLYYIKYLELSKLSLDVFLDFSPLFNSGDKGGI